MDLATLRKISFILAIFGLLLIYGFSPSQSQVKKSISEIRRDCSGPVAIEGTVGNISYSSNGNVIVELLQNRSKILLLLKDSFVEEGSNLSVFGKASKFSNQCWIFPERVELR
jgi:hypothetical protein